jgi:malto-oligosyltrehalose trehalohydrolase
MKRRHVMPFGASLRDDGSTAFRLWAPGAFRVELRLDGGADDLAMVRDDAGWHGINVPAPPGTRYRYVIDGKIAVPDPASRFQPNDVRGPSEVVDPHAFEWQDSDWRGRPWHEAVLYEVHVGTSTPEGTYAGAARHLDELADLGVTAIELMPVAQFPGRRNWGYDGVLPFAPEHRYGRPEDLKRFIAAAHRRGLMVFLDVVYNHFGPEGNYLHRYAPQFFTERHHTPWGAAINFDGLDSRTVRDFFIHNALYWIEEFHLDGLRLDAVHAIRDDSRKDILEALAERVRREVPPDRHVHLVLENDDNAARYLSRDDSGAAGLYTAQWNDDIHHALHVLATGETSGYYADYADRPLERLGRALAEGFAYQGEPSSHRGGRRRGEPSAHLPPAAFVSFLQNHDQVGNRAMGERIGMLAPAAAVRAATAIVLLAPSPPLLFMGEEWGATQPFLFFCDFEPDIADAVRDGRRGEFASLPEFADPAARAAIPDPLAAATFEASKPDWRCASHADHCDTRDFVRRLLDLRRREIVPRLPHMRGSDGSYRLHGPDLLEAQWRLGDGSRLQVLITCAGAAGRSAAPIGRRLFATVPGSDDEPARILPPWYVGWFLDSAV